MRLFGGVQMPRESQPGIAQALHRLATLGTGQSAQKPHLAISEGVGMLLDSGAAWDQRQVIGEEHGLLLAWDGRLDNGRELRQRLGSELRGRSSEAALVLAAYRRWGTGLIAELVGDFRLALWDPAIRTLLLGCDPLGGRPLFYARDGETLAWAGTLEGVLALCPALPAEIDEAWVIGYLTGRPSPGATPYQGLGVLPAGTLKTFCGGAEQAFAAWPPKSLEDFSGMGDAEAEALFLDRFTEAVESHLQADGPVFAELSGGLDSSSIVCVGDRLVAQGKVSASQLHTVSFVFDRSRTCDEREWIEQVEERIGRRGHWLREDDHPLLHGFEEAAFEAPSFLTTFQGRHRRTAALMHAVGARVLLSGIGGDNLVWGEFEVPPQLGDLAAAGRLGPLWRDLRRWQRATGLPYLRLLREGVLRSWLPPGLRRRRQARAMPHHLIAGEFARRLDLGERLRQPRTAAPDGRRPSQRLQLEALDLAVQWRLSQGYLADLALGIEVRYPFLDRRLVELCLRLPAEHFVRPGESRSLHRRALRELLPPGVARRTNKRGPDEALLRAIGREWPRLWALFSGDAEVYQRGWVDRARFLTELEATRFGATLSVSSIDRVLHLEVWLRRLAGLAQRRAA